MKFNVVRLNIPEWFYLIGYSFTLIKLYASYTESKYRAETQMEEVNYRKIVGKYGNNFFFV